MADPLQLLKIEFSADQSVAYATMPLPQVDPTNAPLRFSELQAHLTNNLGIQFLKEPALAKIVENYDKKTGTQKIEIANSERPMAKGTDGYIDWKVDLDNPNVEEDEKGRLDFYSFSRLKNVLPDQELCELMPPVPGIVGISVKGVEIPAPPVKEAVAVAGANVEQRGTSFFATVGGRIEVKGQTITVSRVVEIEKDVDFSTGNILFEGLVKVGGNVVDNFRVDAKEGVQVTGIIEAADIISGGTLTCEGGINTRNKGSITVQADVRTKFFNNCEKASVMGTVFVEKEIINCNLSAGVVECPDVQVSGGYIASAKDMIIKEAGSDLGVKTILHAGYDRNLEAKFKKKETELADRKARDEDVAKKLAAVPKDLRGKLSPEKREALMAMEQRLAEAKAETAKLQGELDEMRKKIKTNDAGITILSAINPGVIVRIGKYEKHIDKRYEGYRRYVFDKEKYDVVAEFEEKGKKKK